MDRNINVTQAKELREKNPHTTFLDVREEEEVAIAAIPDSIHIPLNLLPIKLEQIPKDYPLIVYCHHGVRSLQAINFLLANGFDQIANLKGGINAWSIEIDPTIPIY